jgi:hypothetical protein
VTSGTPLTPSTNLGKILVIALRSEIVDCGTKLNVREKTGHGSCGTVPKTRFTL